MYACQTTCAHAVLDMGANIGYYVQMAASIGCRVRSVEAQARWGPFIRSAAAANNWLDLVDHTSAAVTGRMNVAANETLTFHLNRATRPRLCRSGPVRCLQ